MAYDDIPLWKWCARTTDFKPSYETPDTPFGKRPVVLLPPHWVFDLSLPPKDLTERREIEALIHGTDGVPTFRVYDARVPYPAIWDVINDPLLGDAGIPAITVTAMSKTAATLTVTGTAGDVVTWGDPLAFTFNDRRYYFKARRSVTLTGGSDTLPVFVRPYADVPIVNVAADRIRPTQAFNVRIDDIDQGTDEDHLTRITLSGTEYWGGV